jgi:4-oxalocrotonate tautomerase
MNNLYTRSAEIVLLATSKFFYLRPKNEIVTRDPSQDYPPRTKLESRCASGIVRRMPQQERSMPFICVDMFEGRGIERKSDLVKELTEAFVRTCGGSRKSVTVLIRESKPQVWGVAGKLVGRG